MPAEKPLIYLVLGAAGSGRREVVGNLVADGLEAATERALILLAADEAPDPADAGLPALARWSWNEDRSLNLPGLGDATHVFLIADGRANPVDFIEAAKTWLPLSGGELARILCVVHCQLAEKHPGLLAWYEACAHFADVLLLNRREGVANKWLSSFQNRFREQFFPFLIEPVKAGQVKNPAMILDPQARRMSHVFDEEPNWVIAGTTTGVDDEETEDGDEDVEIVPEEDPYLERRAGGRRVREIPDIRNFLEPS
ncbi:MAG: hypothetical protein KIT44_10015 [Opitutaceae bacterium]|nr:hypothetical protein [Opitutaceae bacterium]